MKKFTIVVVTTLNIVALADTIDGVEVTTKDGEKHNLKLRSILEVQE